MEQKAAIAEIEHWYEVGARPDFKLGGLAGTGKTTIAAALPTLLGLRDSQVAYCAYTGKAAHVLNQRLGEARATTIHRLIYRPDETHCSRCPRRISPRRISDGALCHGAACGICGVRYSRVLVLDRALRLIVVDEASMVSEHLYDDLASYGCPIVWIGDHGQLPPVHGVSRLIASPDLRLETIHRQVADSPILKLAMRARRTGRIPCGSYGPRVLKREADGEIDLDLDMADWSELLILCGTNRTRVALNKAVRLERDYPEARPVPGDRLICLRNNYTSGVFNGMTGTLLDCELESSATYRATIRLDGGEQYEGEIAQEQFNETSTLNGVPRDTDLWDYGYCLTVHKAQGSEAERVILIEERLPGPGGRREALAQYKRWLYTGITRAKSELEIIGRRAR